MFGKENVSFLEIIFQKRALFLFLLIFIAGEILLHTQRGKLNGTYYELILLFNAIQLLVFEETDVKIYRCVKGDIDRREAEVNITFHTPTNLDTPNIVLLLFCVKRLVLSKR